MSVIHIELIAADARPAFEKRVREIAGIIGIAPEWLMQVMYAESRLRPGAANRQKGRLIAAGLLQFTKASGVLSEGMAPSLEAILGMSYLKQLDLVMWYFRRWAGKMHSYYDVYAVVFFPALIGKPDTWVLHTKTVSAATIAKQNPAVSKRQGAITVAMFKTYVINSVPAPFRSLVFGGSAPTGNQLPEAPGPNVKTTVKYAVDRATQATKDVAQTVAKNAGTTTALSLLGMGFLLFF